MYRTCSNAGKCKVATAALRALKCHIKSANKYVVTEQGDHCWPYISAEQRIDFLQHWLQSAGAQTSSSPLSLRMEEKNGYSYGDSLGANGELFF